MTMETTTVLLNLYMTYCITVYFGTLVLKSRRYRAFIG